MGKSWDKGYKIMDGKLWAEEGAEKYVGKWLEQCEK